MKHKFFALLCIIPLITALFAGCSPSNKAGDTSQKRQIIATIFPEYDWTRAVLGDTLETTELTLLLKDGIDLHSYQPTADDLVKIAACDLFIYVGGESDGWVSDALKNPTNKNRKVINLLEVLGKAAKEEKIIEGMEPEAEEDSHGEEIAYDEHVWLSLKNASIFTQAIAETLGTIDADNAKAYEANQQAYAKKLNTLDNAYEKTISESSRKMLLFGDRFPFRYLMDDYHLDYAAAFPGCSSESNASFETITYLAQKIDEQSLPVILILENSDPAVAQAIINATKTKNQDIQVLNAMQSLTEKDLTTENTYLSIMEKNLAVLKTALN